MSRWRSGALPGKHFVYQLECLRKAFMAAASSPSHSDEEAGVLQHHVHHPAEARRVPRLAAVEDVGEVAEEPGPAQAAAPDDDAVAAGRPHHAQRVPGLPHVAVAEDGDAGDATASARAIASHRASPS